jgi:hypothetical protein
VSGVTVRPLSTKRHRHQYATGEVLSLQQREWSFKGVSTAANDDFENTYVSNLCVRISGNRKIAGLVDRANVKINRDISGI